jgi:hypothetical protein
MDDFPIVVMDVDVPLLVIGLAWLAVLGMLAWGGAVEAWRRIRSRQKAPFFGMLERHGFTLVQAEEVVGFAGVRAAASRCASCSALSVCRRALRSTWLGLETPLCPNAAFFARVAGKPVIH